MALKLRFLKAEMLLCLLIILAFTAIGEADTEVSGIIGSDTTWILLDSPYIVIGNVVVLQGVTLTIESGVMVKFESGMTLRIDGELISIGTQENMVTFTSNLAIASAGDWEYILFTDSSADATYDPGGNYTGGSILEYCIVEYAGGSGVRLEKANPFISFCTIQKNSGSGISIRTYSGTMKISNCTITDNPGYGIDAPFGVASMIISNNTITSGIYNYSGAIHISNNNITGGVSLQSHYNTPITISNNNISFGGIHYDSEDVDLKDATFTITGNTISYNDSYGVGGICLKVNSYPYSYNGMVTISDNTIRNNKRTSSQGGGGIYCSIFAASTSECIISNNMISNNSATNGPGGGINCVYSSTIRDNIIMNNTAASYGGGICTKFTSHIRNNVIINNIARDGGGFCFYPRFSDTHPAIVKNIIADNTASSFGGGVYCSNSGAISNNVLTRNVAENGTAFYGNMTWYNARYNTITNNEAIGYNKATLFITQYTLSTGELNFNNIFNNFSTYEVWADGTTDLNAEHNYWGTTEVSEIEAMIYHWIDDPSKGIVDYDPWETEFRTDAPISPPTGLDATASAKSNNLELDRQSRSRHSRL